MKILKTTNTDFKNFIIASILVSGISFSSCSGNDKPDDTKKIEKESPSAKKENTEIENAAKEACNCFAEFEKELSEKGKKIFMEEARKGSDQVVIKLDEKDRELFMTKGVVAYDCMKALEKKYAFLTDFTDLQEKQYNEALKNTCSELGVALMTSK